jgi:6,7-dimethyl-8-ribityllumazine synthase
MTGEFKGNCSGVGKRFALVVSRFNKGHMEHPVISEGLLSGAVETLLKQGVAETDIAVVWVPGAYELPQAANKLAQSGNFDAVICLGVLIRGETSHFDFIAAETARGIGETALRTGIPVAFGVLTTDTVEQALSRAQDDTENKGIETATAALEMANLYEQISN